MATSEKKTEATFKTTSWKEDTIEIPQSPDSALKIARVRTERAFTGSLEGTGVAEYVMTYHPEAPGVTDPHKRSATFNGMMLFKGKYEGSEPGEVVLVTTGTYTPEAGAVAQWTIDEQSATGGLKGAKGTGGYGGKECEMPVWLQFKLE